MRVPTRGKEAQKRGCAVAGALCCPRLVTAEVLGLSWAPAGAGPSRGGPFNSLVAICTIKLQRSFGSLYPDHKHSKNFNFFLIL